MDGREREKSDGRIPSGKDSFSVSAPTVSLPKGGGAIRGMGAKFAANPVIGTGSLSISFATSPGRSGFGPRLPRTHDSGASNGPFGFGYRPRIKGLFARIGRWIIVVFTATGLPHACDSTPPESQGVAFVLNGAMQSTTYLTGDISGSELSLSAVEYDGFGELQLVVANFAGPGTYPIDPPNSTASASLRPWQGMIYDTQLFGGHGQIVVTGYECQTSTFIDAATGITITRTFCIVPGTFETTAKNQAGDSVAITNGHFYFTFPRF